jgi:hypothetical protein
MTFLVLKESKHYKLGQDRDILFILAWDFMYWKLLKDKGYTLSLKDYPIKL